MYVYDQANNLAKSIQESKEYLEYKKVKEELTSNPEMKTKIDEFEKLRYEIQAMSFQGKQDEEIARLDEKRKAGTLGWWGERRLDRLQKGKESQKRIDAAHEALAKSKKKNLTSDEMTAMGLSASEQRRFARQQKAATSKAIAIGQVSFGDSMVTWSINPFQQSCSAS